MKTHFPTLAIGDGRRASSAPLPDTTGVTAIDVAPQGWPRDEKGRPEGGLCQSMSVGSGEAHRAFLAIGHEAETEEPQDHHRPTRRFRDGRRHQRCRPQATVLDQGYSGKSGVDTRRTRASDRKCVSVSILCQRAVSTLDLGCAASVDAKVQCIEGFFLNVPQRPGRCCTRNSRRRVRRAERKGRNIRIFDGKVWFVRDGAGK